MTLTTEIQAEPTLLDAIAARAHAQMVAMIHLANHRPDAQPGDPKVGGHPAACASSLHILGALHLAVREVQDYVCCKPHAAPMDHTYHHLMQLFRREEDGLWLSEEETKEVMHRLRMFPEEGMEYVFQSYHARSDTDSFHFLPSGSVGIPPVVSVYLALAHRYARDHGYLVPPKAHFWSLIGDSEFREGSLLEAMPDVAERLLGNVTWIIDYNRQNLDGTRIPNPKGLHSQDCDRIERTALANGWKVIQIRHGRFRQELFTRPGGEHLQRLLEEELGDFDYQRLLFKGEATEIREHSERHLPEVKKVLKELDDAELLRAFGDVGGHDMQSLVKGLQQSKSDPDEPYMVVVHTIKGWGLECAADPSNHSSLPSQKEVEAILDAQGLSLDAPFELFDPETEEGRYLAQRSETFRAGIVENLELRRKNREIFRNEVIQAGGVPDSLDINTSLYPMVHTQWMWGQLAAKLIRIATHGEGGPELAGAKDKELTERELAWKPAAELVLTLSPDVGTSTNIAPTMDHRIYGPGPEPGDDPVEIEARHPDLVSSEAAWTRHIRFEIAEANCMSAVGAFGKMGHYTGIPFFPIMTVYDFFIKRALDQLYYNLYWGAEFVIMGTPSGVTLSSEGAQHSWKSDIQIPNLITWEPLFAVEVDWILSDAIKRHMEDTNQGRRGVLIRAVTRALTQNQLLECLRRQAANKAELPAGATLKPAGATDEWGAALDEGTLAPRTDAEILEQLKADCLEGGYYLVDWRGYEGYEPGENVVHVFAMGSVATEAVEASRVLSEMGIYANVVVVTSPELLCGLLGAESEFAHLKDRLGIDGDLHAVDGAGESVAGLVSLAGRRVPCVGVCDGERGLLDNIGSIVGVRQITLAVHRFSKCGRPDQVFEYHRLDCDSIVRACGQVLSETALENLNVSPAVLDQLAGRPKSSERPRWRELWPDPPPKV